MRVLVAGQADVATLLETLDSAVAETLQMHAADGLSAEAADALRVSLAAMTASVKAQLLHSVTYPGDTTSCENAAASGVVTAVPVPEMPTPALPSLDESNAALQAELAEVAQRVAVLREQVPNTLRDCAVSLQKTLRSAASSVAACAAGTTLTALQAVAAPGSEAGVVSAEAAEAAAGALVPVDHALAMTADLSESVASLPAVADRLQAVLARMQRVVAAVESRVEVQAPVTAIEAAAAAVLRGDVLDEGVDGAAGAFSADGEASPETAAGPCKTKLQLARGLRHAPY